MSIREVSTDFGVAPPALFGLAERLHDTPDGFAGYDYAKSVWLGEPERAERLAGRHPWPTRIRHGEEYVYSVPVLAAVAPSIDTLLYVGKDAWKPDDDPDAWLVAERHLFTGRELDHRVLTSSVDRARQLWLQLAPSNIDNIPPPMRQALVHQPQSMQIALTGCLDTRYNLRSATIREGYAGRVIEYEDYEAIESMIGVVQQLRDARQEAEHQQIAVQVLVGALGQRGTAYSGV